MNPALSQRLTFHLISPHGDEPRPVEVDLLYDPADPFAVHLTFHLGDRAGSTIQWMLARELLAAGLTGPAGLGDVRIGPAPDEHLVTVVGLSSHDGHARLHVDTEQLERWLWRTWDRVPPGTESDLFMARVGELRIPEETL